MMGLISFQGVEVFCKVVFLFLYFQIIIKLIQIYQLVVFISFIIYFYYNLSYYVLVWGEINWCYNVFLVCG